MNAHRWWCDGQHDAPRDYRGDYCTAPREVLFSTIAIPTASKEDLDAAALLLGYHPTHLLGYGSMFCSACATNVTGAHGMNECPRALYRTGPRQHWLVDGTEGRIRLFEKHNEEAK